MDELGNYVPLSKTSAELLFERIFCRSATSKHRALDDL